MKRVSLFILIMMFSAKALYSQFGFYNALSAGYTNNALYNYQHAGDQTLQNYLELNYGVDKDTSAFRYIYTGTIQLYNRLTVRNYYEHNASFGYSRMFLSKKNRLKQEALDNAIDDSAAAADSLVTQDATGTEDSSDVQDTISADDSTGVADSTEDGVSLQDISRPVHSDSLQLLTITGEFDDSTNAYFDIGSTVSARHDKYDFKEYDNQSLSVFGSYRSQLSDYCYYKIWNDVNIRNYPYLQELSSFTNMLNFRLGNTHNSSFNYGAGITASYKYYLKDNYNSSQFQQARTLDTVAIIPGKGKGGAVAVVKPSAKKILIVADNRNQWQLTYAITGEKRWGSGALSCTALFRHNLDDGGRYLAQYANTSILSEDIYNDSFNYRGYEAIVDFVQKLEWNFNLHITGTVTTKHFHVAALTSLGENVGKNRSDLTSFVDIVITKKISLSPDLNFEIFLNSMFLRNQSNDEYNDYSSASVSLGVAIGL